MDEQKPETPTLTDSSPLSGVTFGVRGCLTTSAGFILGAIVGVGLTVFLWYRIFPPSGPGYGDGMSWGLALMLWAFIGGFSGALLGAFLGVIVGTKRR